MGKFINIEFFHDWGTMDDDTRNNSESELQTMQTCGNGCLQPENISQDGSADIADKADIGTNCLPTDSSRSAPSNVADNQKYAGRVNSRLDTFKQVAKEYSLIRLLGKRPIERGWEWYCFEKRPSEEIGFGSGENAGITTMPANGLLSLAESIEHVQDIITEKVPDEQATKSLRLYRARTHPRDVSQTHYILSIPSSAGIQAGGGVKVSTKTLVLLSRI